MQDLTSNYIKWISDFNTEQFDQVVECYLEQIWGITDFTDTDGTNDGGNDIRISQNNEKLKIQIQVTVQESGIEGKITKELENAVENIKKHGYERKLYFLYSHPISEDKINDFETKAKLKYNIQLVIIDAKKIASAAKYSQELRDVIHDQYGLETAPKVLSEEDKMLYDFISFGSNTHEIKSQIIKAYIGHKLYEHGELSRDGLLKSCCEHFGSKDTRIFEKQLNNSRQEGVINEERKGGKSFYTLSEGEATRIGALKSQFSFQEQKLSQDIKIQLEKFDIKVEHTVKIIEKLRELFESNFNIDKQEIIDQAYLLTEEEKANAFKPFYHFIRVVAGNPSKEKIRLLTKNLLNICKENDILQRLSAGKLFASFSDPDIIRNYIRQTDRIVFCDTRIALYALCIYYEEIDHTDNFYESVKDFLNLRKRYGGFHYKIYHRYINEISFHIKEALQLIPYEENDLFLEFGGTGNIFFNYYTHLKQNDFLEGGIDSFADFMFEWFELQENDVFKQSFQSITERVIVERLENQGISLFEKDLSQDYFVDAKRIIQDCQALKIRFRPEANVNNDAKMMSVLFDTETSVNEPVFITWDQTLFSARRKFYELHKAARLWHYFTPNQFVSHISVLNFNINSQTITREVLSVFDEGFDFYKQTHHILDTITKLLNIRTETGRKYVQKIKEFKKENIYQINKAAQVAEVSNDEHWVPIERILLKLTQHYSSKKGKYNIDQFKLLLSVGEVFDSVISYFKAQIESMQGKQELSDDAFSRLDNLIEEAIGVKTREIENMRGANLGNN
jgi:hypothetical protein